jgi:hypothetical protein
MLQVFFRVKEIFILPDVLYGCETSISHSKGMTRIEVVSKQSAKDNIWTKVKEDSTKNKENCRIRRFILCTLRPL